MYLGILHLEQFVLGAFELTSFALIAISRLRAFSGLLAFWIWGHFRASLDLSSFLTLGHFGFTAFWTFGYLGFRVYEIQGV